MNEVFRASSDPTRREIVRLLRSGSRTAGELAEAFPRATSTLSARFAALKQAGLLEGREAVASIVCRLNTTVLHDVVAVVMEWLDDGKARETRRQPPAARDRSRPK